MPKSCRIARPIEHAWVRLSISLHFKITGFTPLFPLHSFSPAAGTQVLAQTSIQFGPYYSLGATTSYIVEAETTLYPGDTPSPQQDRLALWPGMRTDDGGLIQSIVLSVADPSAECGAEAGEWCTFASLYTGSQESGDEVPLSPSDGVTITYKYDETTESYTQTISISGTVVSTLTSSVGKAIGWGTAVECQDDCSGTVNAHYSL